MPIKVLCTGHRAGVVHELNFHCEYRPARRDWLEEPLIHRPLLRGNSRGRRDLRGSGHVKAGLIVANSTHSRLKVGKISSNLSRPRGVHVSWYLPVCWQWQVARALKADRDHPYLPTQREDLPPGSDPIVTSVELGTPTPWIHCPVGTGNNFCSEFFTAVSCSASSQTVAPSEYVQIQETGAELPTL